VEKRLREIILLIALLAGVVAYRAFIPRYIEESRGVRDRWTRELCPFGSGAFTAFAFCDSGMLTQHEGKWHD